MGKQDIRTHLHHRKRDEHEISPGHSFSASSRQACRSSAIFSTPHFGHENSSSLVAKCLLFVESVFAALSLGVHLYSRIICAYGAGFPERGICFKMSLSPMVGTPD